MLRLVIIVPGLVGREGEESLLDTMPGIPNPTRVLRLAPLEGIPTPELCYFGMPPGEAVAPGAMVVAALRVEPPDDAVRFRLTAGALIDGVLSETVPPRAEEQSELLAVLRQLSGRRLVTVAGRGLEHALVWEQGSIDLQTTPWRNAQTKNYADVLPSGEGDEELRRLIDDSVNAMHELEFNRRRADEGMPPINILWPWGQGFAPRLTPWPIRYGEPLQVLGESLALEGIARLLGLTFTSLENPWRSGLKELLGLPPLAGLAVTDVFSDARQHHQLERAEKLWHQISRELLAPILERRDDTVLRVAVLSPNLASEGLGAVWNVTHPQHDRVPFHQRVLGDTMVPLSNLWDVVLRCWARPSG